MLRPDATIVVAGHWSAFVGASALDWLELDRELPLADKLGQVFEHAKAQGTKSIRLVLNDAAFAQALVPWSSLLIDRKAAIPYVRGFLEDTSAGPVDINTLVVQRAGYGKPRLAVALESAPAAAMYEAATRSGIVIHEVTSLLVTAIAMAQRDRSEPMTVLVAASEGAVMAPLERGDVQRLLSLPRGDSQQTVQLAQQRLQLLGPEVGGTGNLAVLAADPRWHGEASKWPEGVKTLELPVVAAMDINAAARFESLTEAPYLTAVRRAPNAAWWSLAGSTALLAVALWSLWSAPALPTVLPVVQTTAPRLTLETAQVDAIRRAVDELNAPYAEAFHLLVPRDRSAIEVVNVEFQPAAPAASRSNARVVADAVSLLAMTDYLQQVATAPAVVFAELVRHETTSGGSGKKLRFTVELRLAARPAMETRP